MSTGSLQDVIVNNISRWVYGNVNTCIPAEIISVDLLESDQIITAQPVINNVREDGVILELPPVTCPVQFPSGGGGIISFPIQVGDVVTLVFSMSSLDNWLSGLGERVTPSDRRKYAFTDAIAFPSLYTPNTTLNPSQDDVEIKFNGSSFKLKADKSGNGVELTTNADVTINCVNANINASSKVTIDTPEAEFTADVTIGGNLEVTGTSTAADHDSGGVSGNSHVHGGVQSGGSNTAPPT